MASPTFYHPRPERWPQVSLKGLFVVVTVFGIWLGVQVKWSKDRQAELQWLEDVHATYLYSSAWTDASKTKMVAEGSGVIPLGYVARPCSAPWGLRFIGERGVTTIVVLREGDSDESVERKKRSLMRLFPEAKIWIGSKSADCHIW